MKKNEYKCSECGEVYEKDWSDKECMAEKKRNFGTMPMEIMCVVCDDCYKKVMKRMGHKI